MSVLLSYDHLIGTFTATNMAMTLEDLLYRCALNDEDALASLYKQTSAKLYALVLGMVIRRDVAEDIMQEAYINIWHYANQYREEKGSALTWMIGIIRNKAIDWLRRNPKGRVISDETLDELIDPLLTADMSMVNADEAQALIECIEALDDSQRKAITKVYYLGLTHHEYADHSGHPLGTIKSWIRRGLQKLKRCLEI